MELIDFSCAGGLAMELTKAAEMFLAWTASFGAYSPELGVSIPNIESIEGLGPVTDAGKNTLKSKQVVGVIQETEKHELIVLTRKVTSHSKKVLATLPDKFGDVSITYRQGSILPVDTSPSATAGMPTYRLRDVGGLEKYCCGSSISVGNNREAGTFGCLVRNANGDIFGLSNNHVSGSCSHAGLGLPILAPGICDIVPGCKRPFTIGFHERSLPMIAGTPDNVDVSKNNDAAIFRIADASEITSFQGEAYDTPAQADDIKSGQIVEKVGRTTGHTKGTVLGEMNGPVAIPYQAQIYGFSGRVFFQSLFVVTGMGELFSTSGDSGSLVTTIDGAGQRVAVGLLVGSIQDGTASGGSNALILPLKHLINEMGVNLVFGHNI
jgi:hypothetical protein